MAGGTDIKAVAERCGVSISTVSNALNKTGRVSKKTAEKINRIAKELGYRGNPIAKGLKGSKTGQIGVIVEDMCGVFYPYVVRGINSVLTEKGYDLLIFDAHGVNGNEAAIDREQNYFLRLLSARVDGILFVTACKTENLEAYLKPITERAFESDKFTPIVSLERDLTNFGIDSVYYDPYTNAKSAVEHLIGCGCRKICHISGPPGMQIAQRRISGYIGTMDANELEVDVTKMVAYGDYSHQSGYKAMCELVEKCPNLDGVFCGNDQMAVGALKALMKYGIRVPEDVKIIGYDDTFVSTITHPAITTIHVPKVSTGAKAAELLISRIEAGRIDNYVPVGIKMEGHLVVRESTVLGSPDDWQLTNW